MRRGAFSLAAALLMMTLISGCGTLERAAPGGGPGDLLAFYRYAGALDRETRINEYRNFRNWVRDGRCSPDRMRLSMLAMHMGGEMGADPQAILAPCLGGDERPPPRLRDLAMVLNDQLQRRAGLEQRIARLEQRRQQLERQREQLQADLEAAQRERERLAAEHSRLSERVEALEKQLDALRNIEQSIRQRE
jgi:hypothetical protein